MSQPVIFRRIVGSGCTELTSPTHTKSPFPTDVISFIGIEELDDLCCLGFPTVHAPLDIITSSNAIDKAGYVRVTSPNSVYDPHVFAALLVIGLAII